MLLDHNQLDLLRRKANEALFDLHDYIRQNSAQDDERWKLIFIARSKTNEVTGQLIKEAIENEDK